MALATRSLLVSAPPKAKANSNLLAPASSSSSSCVSASTSSLSCLEPQARLVSSFYGAGVKSQQRCQNGGQARGGSSSCKALKWWASSSSSSKKEGRKHEVSSPRSSWFANPLGNICAFPRISQWL
jgi:hypothetical protein